MEKSSDFTKNLNKITINFWLKIQYILHASSMCICWFTTPLMNVSQYNHLNVLCLWLIYFSSFARLGSLFGRLNSIPNLVKSIMPMKCGTQAGKSYSWAWSAKCSITDLCQQGGNPYCIILCFCQRTSNCISKETTCPEKMRERAFPNTVLTRNYAPPFCWLGLATSMGGGGVGGLIIEYV